MATPPFQAGNTEFAYQLRYHFGFQTRRRRPVFTSEVRRQSLIEFLTQVCQRGNYHLLEHEHDQHWLRMLISLTPGDAPSKVVQVLKANTSRLMLERFPEIEREVGRRALWSRGFYVRSVGDVTASVIQHYLARQREHHTGRSRLLAEYRHSHPEPLLDLRRFSHCVAEYNCHLVICPVRHIPAIDEKFAQPLLEYILRVARKRDFEVISSAVLDDHVHLLAALPPKQSPDQLALTVMNNTSHWFRQQNPGVFKVWDVPGFWAGSAYLGTAGAVTSKQIRNFLRREAIGDAG